MLRKMLKYDIQAMSKTLIPFFIAILVISVFSALSMHLEWLIGIFGGATILFGLGIALFVTSLVLIITQFYKNVLGDQGYLTNTLPVSVDTIILSKLFSAIFWLISSGIVAILAFLIILMGSMDNVGDFFTSVAVVLQSAFDFISTPEYFKDALLIILLLVLLFIFAVLLIANEILHFYCAMSCSQIYPFTKNRIAGSFIAYLLINIPLSILTAVLFSAVGFTGTSFEWIQNLSGYSMMFIAILSVSLVILFLNILLYVPIRYILKNKLNLE